MTEKTRQKYISQHRCIKCKCQLDPQETRQMCQNCMEKHLAKKKVKYNETFAQGICVICRTNKRDEGYSSCTSCREYCRRNYKPRARKQIKFNWSELINE